MKNKASTLVNPSETLALSRATMPLSSLRRRYALCIGIGEYTNLTDHNLRFAVPDAEAVAKVLRDPQRGNFKVSVRTTPAATTKQALEKKLYDMLNMPALEPEDLVVIYISCHGAVYGKDNTFYLLPSDATLEENGRPVKPSVLDINDITKVLSDAPVKNIVFFLDTCHSGGAGDVFRSLPLNHYPDTNLFIIGAARRDQSAIQSGKLKHGIFTSCLLQAFEQKPTVNHGWLTLSQIHTYVARAIQEHGEIQIQASSTSVDPNLLLVQNPKYSPNSLEFAKEARRLLELAGYRPLKSGPPEGAPVGYYMAELKAGFAARKIGVITYYDEVQSLLPEQAEQMAGFIKEQIEDGALDEGLLLTSLEVNNAVKKAIRTSGVRYLTPMTSSSVLRRLIDFDAYLQKIAEAYHEQNSILERFDQPPLSEVYIPLRAESRDYEHEIAQAEAVNKEAEPKLPYEVTWTGDLEEEVKRWLADPEQPRLALLADFGSGKTTFCFHLTAKMAEEYLSKGQDEVNQPRIPLLVQLREFARNSVDLEGYLIAHLKQRCEVENPNYRALRKMAEEGLLLFIFDGFDEMAMRADSDTVRQNIMLFEELAKLPKNKVLLTTRPEYFVNLNEEREALRNYPRLYLKQFNQTQITTYLQKRVPYLRPQNGDQPKDWVYYRDQIKEIYDLSDLVPRPVLLEMIVKTLPKLVVEGEAVNRPNLYQHYLEEELERQTIEKRRYLLIKRDKRFEIVERLALELYQSDRTALTGPQIRELSKGMLTSEQQGEMEATQRELLACSFLIRTGDDYRFSHQSFQEYLVGCRLAKDIAAEKPANLRQKLLNRSIREFLVELEAGIVQNPTFSATKVILERTRLANWLKFNSRDRWLSTNAASLLAGLTPRYSFANHALQGAWLNEADLSGADLTGANLFRVDLSNATLVGANLNQTDLFNANLSKADLSGAELVKAKLDGTDLTGANLSGATLVGADLSRTKLVGANLSGANLVGADLSGADLSGAKLVGAKLVGAKLPGTNLSRAKFDNADLDEVEWGKIAPKGTEGKSIKGRIICDGAKLDQAKNLDTALRKQFKQGGALLPS